MGATQSVLIARHDSTRTVYAIEPQKDGLYAMCRLGAWVSLEELAQDATAVCQERVFPAKADGSPEKLSMATMTPQMSSHQKKKRAAIEAIQSLVRKKPKAEEPLQQALHDVPTETQREEWGEALKPTPEIMIPVVKQSIEETPGPEPLAPQKTKTDDKMVEPAISQAKITQTKPVAEEKTAISSSQLHTGAIDDGPQDMATNIFENIRAHYVEALYKSMASYIIRRQRFVYTNPII